MGRTELDHNSQQKEQNWAEVLHIFLNKNINP